MADNKKIDYIQERIDLVATTVANIDKDVALQKACLESHTAQDELMYGELKRMNNLLQQNTESLKEHMQNNLLLKDMIASMDKRLQPIEVQRIEKEAVRTFFYSNLKLIGKVGATIIAVAGAWIYVKPFIEQLLK